jgi:exopolysaccharide production protein ExoZ
MAGTLAAGTTSQIPDRTTPPRLMSLEIGRFVAAALVALFHYSGSFEDNRSMLLFDGVLRVGSIGVNYFFVLSGFVIYHIHAADIGRSDRVGSFLWKRAIRVYPFFWAACIPMLLVAFLSDVRDPGFLDFPGTIADLLLLPYDGEQILGVAWTLRQELVFYAIFAVLIAAPRAGWPLLIAWLLASATIFVFVPGAVRNGWIKPFAYSFNIGFGLGMLAAWGYAKRPTARPGYWIAAGGSVLLLLCVRAYRTLRELPSHTPTPTGDTIDPILFSIGFGMLVYGLACRERMRSMPQARILLLLGGSSYFLYLIHGFVGSVVIRVLDIGVLHHLPAAVVLAAMLAAAVMAAVLAHLWFERPVLRILRSAFRFQPAVAQTE